MAFYEEERAELIAALTNTVTFAAALLEACRHLTNALEWQTPPTAQQIKDARKHLDRWRQNLDKLKQRLASLAIEPPKRVQ